MLRRIESVLGRMAGNWHGAQLVPVIAARHQRQMMGYSLEHWRFLEEHIWEWDRPIVAQIEALGYSRQGELLQSVAGIKENRAASVLAESGPDRGQLETEKPLSWWAGVCPGNHRSAGQNKGSKTTQGNRWWRAALTACA